MATKKLSRHVIPGSDRQPVSGARVIGPTRPDERMEVTLVVREMPAPKASTGATTPRAVQADAVPAQRQYLTREQYAARHGAAPADLATVAAFAAAHGLQVVASDAGRRSVVLAGTSAAMSAAFDVALNQYEHNGGTYRGRVGSVSVPASLADVVVGVFGLDNRPQADPHHQFYRPLVRSLTPHATASFTPPALAKLYNFPTGLDGSGQCIGIIELGGGWRPADLKTYFSGRSAWRRPGVKTISRRPCGRNRPTSGPDSADGEVMLDIEVAGAVAPKALDRGLLRAQQQPGLHRCR